MFLKFYLIALPIFFLVDMTWLGLIAKNFYRSQIGTLLKPDVNWVAAIIFYLLFLAGLVFFVIEPAMQKQAWSDALLRGAFFGLVTQPQPRGALIPTEWRTMRLTEVRAAMLFFRDGVRNPNFMASP